VAHGARLGIAGLADADLAAGALGGEAVQVRMIARSHLPAAATGAARPGGRIGVVAEQAGSQIQGQGRLSDRTRPYQQYRMRRLTEDHRIDLGQGPCLAARRRAIHRPRLFAGRLATGRLAATE
jgi:hypothetical protein